jgi:hypothetical protein
MDLVTLVTACSLAFDPKVMHALVWQHSGAEPWSVLVKGEASPRVYANVWQAVDEMRVRPPAGGRARVGLAGLPADPSEIRAALFLPCRNIAIAAEQLAELVDRCKTHPRLNGDPTFCAIAVYRGSWERPTPSSRMPFRHQLRKATLRTSTCRMIPNSIRSTSHPNFPRGKIRLHVSLQLSWKSESKAGRVAYSQQNQANQTARFRIL